MARKVLFTASTFSHILNFHLPYLKWFRDQGWQVHVACGGEAVPIPYTDKVTVLPFRKKMTAPENFRAAALLRKMVQAGNYTLVSTHTVLAAFFTRLALKGLGERPKVVNTVHGYLFDDDTPAFKRNILLAAERLTASETDLLLTMNQWDYEAAKKYKLCRKIQKIPGVGVDFPQLDQADPEAGLKLRSKLGLPWDAFVLIYPAEFSRRKSQEVLIRVLAKLPEQVVLVLPGEGELLKDCRLLAAQLGLVRRVRFPGQVRDMGPWYEMADAAVTASRSEGLPFNVMEAMHCSLPVVASAVKGHTDLIQDGENGLLYPYGDAEACAMQIQRLISSPPLQQELGRKARKNAEQYDIDQVLPVVTSAYEDFLPDLTGAPAYLGH